MVACRVPVVAAVNGPAVGLGCSLVALSDIVYMAESAHLADPHVMVGLVAADGGPVTWPLLTSLQLAKEYALTGDRIPARRAAEIGLVNHVCPDDEVLDQALACAQRIAAAAAAGGRGHQADPQPPPRAGRARPRSTSRWPPRTGRSTRPSCGPTWTVSLRLAVHRMVRPARQTGHRSCWVPCRRRGKGGRVMAHFAKPVEGSWTEHYPELGTGPVSYEDSISPEHYELERRAIFARTWLNVGRVEQLPRAGSYFTKELAAAGTSVVVVRGTDGEMRAFHNICRHRGNKLVWNDYPREETSGVCRQFTCKYHGWRYDLEGALTFVQQESEFFDLDRDEYGLVPVQTETWEGFIFVNLDPDNTRRRPSTWGTSVPA